MSPRPRTLVSSREGIVGGLAGGDAAGVLYDWAYGAIGEEVVRGPSPGPLSNRQERPRQESLARPEGSRTASGVAFEGVFSEAFEGRGTLFLGDVSPFRAQKQGWRVPIRTSVSTAAVGAFRQRQGGGKGLATRSPAHCVSPSVGATLLRIVMQRVRRVRRRGTTGWDGANVCPSPGRDAACSLGSWSRGIFLTLAGASRNRTGLRQLAPSETVAERGDRPVSAAAC